MRKVKDGPMKVTLSIDEIVKAVRGARVALLTNGTFWVEQAGDDITGIVKHACRELVVLYSEHGPRGCDDCGEPSSQTCDAYLGCRVYDVYNVSMQLRDPNPEAMADVDLLMVAMPDIGCRHYTYKRAMCYVLKEGARRGLPVIVVDFPNPVAGHKVEGNVPDPSYWAGQRGYPSSPWFTAPLAYRYGMTMGELALFARGHLELDLDLRIVKLRGWRRNMYWDDTGCLYVPMDPSIYNATTPLYFLCTGLFQGTNTSWGIGTAEPFQVIGAPWIEDDRLLHALRQRKIPGITWSRAHFLPRSVGKPGMWRSYVGEICNGVRLHITDRDALETARVQLTLFEEMFRLFPDKFHFGSCDDSMPNPAATNNRLCDEQWTRRMAGGEKAESILVEWKKASKQFEQTRKPYLLY